MNDAPAAIERTWFAVAPDGGGRTITLGVGPPRQQPGGEWGVLASLDPLEPPRTIFGVDGWQATVLGMRFLADRVANLSACGWQFYWAEGEAPARAEDLEA